MTRTLCLAAILATASSCGTAVQHPAPTVAIVAGVIGFGTCEIDEVKTSTCGIVGGSAALVLGGITALVYLLTDQPLPQMEGEEVEPEQRVHRHHAPIILPPDESSPTPVPVPASPSPAVDAGVPDAA